MVYLDDVIQPVGSVPVMLCGCSIPRSGREGQMERHQSTMSMRRLGGFLGSDIIDSASDSPAYFEAGALFAVIAVVGA